MASQNDYDGLHVQRLEQMSSPPRQTHISQYYSSQPEYETKEPLSTLASPQHYNNTQYHGSSQPPPPPFPSEEKSRRNPWGLSPLAFGALIAIITAIVVGAAVGGGVSTIGSKNNCATSQHTTTTGAGSSTTGTSTSTATSSGSTTAPTGTFANYIPASVSSVQSLYNDCASLNGSSVQSAQGPMFRVTCPQAILGSSGTNGVTLSELVAYTLQDCINACTLMNFWKGSTVCNSITWDAGMAGATAANFGGNCWLFDDSTTFQVKANSTSARLTSS